ncbi:phosphatase PAP2 family protein, partial [Stomatobaculum sp.]
MDQNKTNYSPAHILAREHLFTVICLYTVFYIFWFRHLEQTVSGDYLIMHTKVDEWIPFLPVFIVPYLLWFLYIFAALVYFSRADKDEAADLCLFLALGMTSSLLICTLFPNGTDLRIAANPANGFFEHLVWMIQRTDTPTNVFPSIHVFNALAVHAAVARSKTLRRHPLVQGLSLLLMVSICLSTVFLKQHSVLDVLG